MNKIIRCGNKNSLKAAVLLVLRTLCAIILILLPIAFVILKLYRDKLLTAALIILIILCAAALPILSKRYKILHSGTRGEKQLFKTVRKLKGNNIIFTNLPVKYNGRSEVDALVINQGGVIIIEAKNHSGMIYGNWRADKWEQQKRRRNKNTVLEMENPIKQMRRQRDIVKGMLNAAGENIKVDTVLFFSNDNVRLNLNLRGEDHVCHGSSELLDFLEKYSRKKVLSKSRAEKCAGILNNARTNSA